MARNLLTLAAAGDATAIAVILNAAADDLTARHGVGWWSGHCTERGVLRNLRRGQVCVARRRGHIVATLMLSKRKPWAIDRRYFSPAESPLYLTHMAVRPKWQRRGIGRTTLAAAGGLALRLGADAIRLDAFDHPAAGAGPFYARCGFRPRGRATYRGVPLLYFEMLLA